MNITDKLQSAILKNDIEAAKPIIKEIKENFVLINLHTILNMAILHSTPQMIELIIDELSEDLNSHILMGAFDNINTGTERYFENYKKTTQKRKCSIFEYPTFFEYLVPRSFDSFPHCNLYHLEK